ncbi:related to cell wall protein UTR2 [Sporisorium reilianum f. sp. reilianum]|uniref:Related to cell wall protein UTR2 n=1 Tax=Sporisorium reilianum f. sp. reilianum TaxID=72559 RepID=A0A2N8U7C8_9BASI|nr:related to cell wall protein UTR2 [Sporisorium reilianum f. sp. reilianum]
MARSRRKAALRLSASLLAGLILASTLPSTSAQTSRITCSTSSLCPESSPCCSSEGVCGSGAMQCAGGCDPMSSFKPSSCLPNPVCRSRQMTIKPSDYNDNSVFMPILEYNGNASSPFTLDSGSLGAGPEGVLLQLSAAQHAKISTTDYLMYGYVEATLRHNARQGLVAAFIFMSNIKDEVDWEFTTSNSSLALTNYFWMGQPVRDHGLNVTAPNFNVSDWHTYGLNWTSSQLQWSIDGTVVRTLTRAQAGTSYPRSPSRIQFSTWAGGNETNPQGTIDWAGGPLDWNSPEYKKNGFYSQEIKQFNVQCASLGSLNLTSGSGSSNGNITSYVYTGGKSTTTLEPAFGTSTDPLRILSDPAADGYPGYPGYGANSAQSGKDGKNSKDSKDAKSSSKDSNNHSKDGDANAKDDAAANSSSTSTSGCALPISGAIIGLTAIWAVIAFVRRRHLKAPIIINAIGVTGVNDARFSGPSRSGFERSSNTATALAYHDLENEPASMYRNEPNMNLMMGGGFMSDAGLSHLQRQTTGGSKVSRTSSRSVADRLLGTSGRAQRYQQLDATMEEEAMDQVSRQRPYLAGANPYQHHAYEQAAREEEDEVEEYVAGHAHQTYYGTSISSPVKRNATVATSYYEPNTSAADQSFEACQLQSPQRHALPVNAVSPSAPPPRPSGRMYDTPNVNYYPTPVLMQSDGYVPNVHAPAAAPYTHISGGAGYYTGGYAPMPPPRHR